MRITAWSYSRYSDYDKCPLLARLKYIDKIPEPENPAMANGTRVHNSLSAFLGNEEELPEAGQKFATLLYQLKELEPMHDQDWGYTSQWKPTGWFAKDTWFRSKLDSVVLYDDNSVDVVDFKTGKEDAKHALQAELYAISVLVRYTDVTHVVARFWYLDHGAESVHRFARSDLAELIAKWEKRVKPMLADETFAPKPGKHCAWCAYAKSRGGVCKFG